MVDGNVYDITGWVNRHPGGDVIATLAGEDASTLFHSSHLDQRAREALEPLKIGEVQNYRPDFKTVNDDFYSTLKRRVADYFARNNINHHDTGRNQRRVLLSAALLFLCWACIYLFPPWGGLAVIPMGLLTCSLVGTFGHEQIHGNLDLFGRRTVLSRLANDIAWGLMIPFMPERFFQYEHIRHHHYSLHPDHDYDVFALRGLVRLSPLMERKRHHAFQHLYAPLVYGFYIFLQLLSGYTSDFFSRRELLKDKGVLRGIVISSITAALFYVAIPIYLTDPWWTLACSGSYFFIWQSAIYVTSGLPHMTDPDAVPDSSGSWAFHVCRTTKDLKCGNRFYDWLTGGLNYHLEHHLLPTVPRDYLPRIRHIVRDVCGEFGYPFHTYDSFTSYYMDHYRFLVKLGSPPVRQAAP